MDVPPGYLDHACLGVPGPATTDAVSGAVADLAAAPPRGTEQSIAWLELAARAREQVARLVGAHRDDITLVQNTTEGLATVLTALPWRAGDVVVVADREFLAAVTVCRWLAHARGLDLRIADGPAPEQLRPHLGPTTRAVVLSAVGEVSGVQADVAAAGAACADVGAVLVVDGAQEAGVVHRHLPSSGADAYATGGHKWLRAPFGTGFLWTSPRLRDQLVPPARGYLALAEPAGGWGAYLGSPGRDARQPIPFRADAAALEGGGTPNWVGALALRTAVGSLLAAGPARIERQATALADRLRSAVTERGFQHCLMDPAGSSPLVGLAIDEGATGVDTRLADRGVHVSVRGALGQRVLRVSCHGWNRSEDVDLLLEAIDDGVVPLAECRQS